MLVELFIEVVLFFIGVLNILYGIDVLNVLCVL